MTTPTEPRILADTGGLVVTDDGRRVLVFDRGTGALAVTAFVLGIVAIILIGFGAVALFGLSAAVGAAFLAVGVVGAVGTGLAVRTFRRRRAQPLNACNSVAVIDRKLGLFSYAGGAILPLDQVRFERRMQIGSSSPKLVAVLPRSTRVLKRGNPFDGGIGDVDQVLTAAIARVSPQS
ncbi:MULTISPECIES: hypothetical protein [unclassified Mycobacterium]|uniref:hypothetical protein n=1 Tax=unclassified Mycobacterium TaxID=2642494 RepID=UPI0029C7EE55|nr:MULTISPECIES: hypothetical protein [unclassified Mycobacterium]